MKKIIFKRPRLDIHGQPILPQIVPVFSAENNIIILPYLSKTVNVNDYFIVKDNIVNITYPNGAIKPTWVLETPLNGDKKYILVAESFDVVNVRQKGQTSSADGGVRNFKVKSESATIWRLTVPYNKLQPTQYALPKGHVISNGSIGNINLGISGIVPFVGFDDGGLKFVKLSDVTEIAPIKQKLSSADGATANAFGIQYGKATYIISGVGFLAGLAYAFKTKKGFWGYVGFGLLGSVSGTVIGGILDNTVFKKKPEGQSNFAPDKKAGKFATGREGNFSGFTRDALYNQTHNKPTSRA